MISLEDHVADTVKPIKQYRYRRLPNISPDLKWGCLWMALLLGTALVITVTNGGTL